jgi:hypothetical protein
MARSRWTRRCPIAPTRQFRLRHEAPILNRREAITDDRREKGRPFASLFSLPISNLLMHAYLDLARLGLFLFRHAYLEHTVSVGCFDAIVLHGFGQGK